MAKTRTQKLRKRLEREGRYDVTLKRRGREIAISTLTKRTKTKRELLEAKSKKHPKKSLD